MSTTSIPPHLESYSWLKLICQKLIRFFTTDGNEIFVPLLFMDI
jgi:hypothetical protein